MDDSNNDTLDLSRRGLKKVEKAPSEEAKSIINLILDQNELQRLDNIDTYNRLENLSICNNFLVRMHGVSRLSGLRVLALNNNGILQIEGLKDMVYLKVLKLAGNNIKSIEHLNHNIHLEHLDLSNNQISFIADISYLKDLKHLSLERNRIADLRQCERYLPPQLAQLALAHNGLQDLNEVSHLVHLAQLDSFTVQGNPCVAAAGKDKLGFDYRPFVLNWIMSLKSIDGFVVSAMESLKAEWLYSQGRGRHFHSGQQRELCEYLASTCPLTADALETEDQRKLRLILSKAQHHQQQLQEQHRSAAKCRMQSPRVQSRMSQRNMGRSPDRLSSSFHGGVPKPGSPAHAMSLSCGELPAPPATFDSPQHSHRQERLTEQQPPQQPSQPKLINHSLEAASKMVPVPESLMSPDYQDPMFDIQKTNSTTSSQSSNGSVCEEKRSVNKSLKGSPKLTKSATSSPKLKSKIERKGSLSKIEIDRKINGVTTDSAEHIDPDKLEVIKLATNQRRQKKLSVETMAAVTIQKMWRGYRSRNLNKDTLRILHAIQAARARQHVQRLTCDMEATKAALESERKIQQLQMQAINALWKKVSTLQSLDPKSRESESEDNSEALRQLTETCVTLQAQVLELQSCMHEVLRAVCGAARGGRAEPVATQTDIVAVVTPQVREVTLQAQVVELQEVLRAVCGAARGGRAEPVATQTDIVAVVTPQVREVTLQAQVVELQEVLRAVCGAARGGRAEPVATQTDIVAVVTPQVREVTLQAQVVELQEVLRAVCGAARGGRAEPVATQTDIVAVVTPQVREVTLQAQVVELQEVREVTLQAQVVELQEVLRAVCGAARGGRAEPVATQTDIVAVVTPQEERCGWLRRPQSLALSAPVAAASAPVAAASAPVAAASAPVAAASAPVAAASAPVAAASAQHGEHVATHTTAPTDSSSSTDEVDAMRIERTAAAAEESDAHDRADRQLVVD
nr:centrosomal protein of 97 kDa [Maniola hyperantus]